MGRDTVSGAFVAESRKFARPEASQRSWDVQKERAAKGVKMGIEITTSVELERDRSSPWHMFYPLIAFLLFGCASTSSISNEEVCQHVCQGMEDACIDIGVEIMGGETCEEGCLQLDPPRDECDVAYVNLYHCAEAHGAYGCDPNAEEDGRGFGLIGGPECSEEQAELDRERPSPVQHFDQNLSIPSKTRGRDSMTGELALEAGVGDSPCASTITLCPGVTLLARR